MPLPSSKNTPPKSLGELLTDPHFIFTILSLIMSLVVFFYYLYQLLFKTDWKGDTPSKARAATTATRAEGFKKANSTAAAAGRTSADKQKEQTSQVSDEAKFAELESRVTERIAARKKEVEEALQSLKQQEASNELSQKTGPSAKTKTTTSVNDIDESLDVTMDNNRKASQPSAAADSSTVRHRKPAAKIDD